MAKSRKQRLKEKRRRNARPAPRRFLPEPEFAISPSLSELRPFKHEVFEITEEPLFDARLDAVPEPDRSLIDGLGEQVINNVADVDVEVLKKFAERYPHIPTLQSWLCGCYDMQGRVEDARRLKHALFEKFPDYLFAVVGYCMEALDRGDLDEAERVIGGCFTVKQRYPKREVFHLSEVIAYQGLIATFMAAIEDFEAADIQCAMLEEMAPDHPGVKALFQRVEQFALMSLMRGIKESIKRDEQRRAQRSKKRKKR